MASTRLMVVLLFGVLVARSATALTIDTVPIGNPGNAPDTKIMVNDGTSGYGAVNHTYRMGKYDVTVGQYTAFLNAVAAADTYGLYNPSMATDLNIAGIARTGGSGGYRYGVIGSPNHPITYVSWGDAARFCNWLSNGQPSGAEGPGTTETGSYTLNGAVSNTALNATTRNPGAKWFIPSENEWYKAAFFDPVAGHYWTYATGTNTAPTSAPPGSTPNTANFYDTTTGYALTGSTSNNRSQNYLTDVGAYTASASPYGTYDQNGDVAQWDEGINIEAFRVARGGGFGTYPRYLASSLRSSSTVSIEISNIGFRVATIPEPSSEVLAILACAAMWLRRRFND